MKKPKKIPKLYFQHDADSRLSPQMVHILKEIGWVGYGWYYAIKELLCKEPDHILQNSVASLGILLDIQLWEEELFKKAFQEMINQAMLKIPSYNPTCFYCPELTKEMLAQEEKKKRYQKAGSAGGRARIASLGLTKPSSFTGEEVKEKSEISSIATNGKVASLQSPSSDATEQPPVQVSEGEAPKVGGVPEIKEEKDKKTEEKKGVKREKVDKERKIPQKKEEKKTEKGEELKTDKKPIQVNAELPPSLFPAPALPPYNASSNELYRQFFDTDTFKSAWESWKEYKKAERKGLYKTEAAELAQLVRLQRLSGKSEVHAIRIIKESIEQHYQGLFPLKDNQQTVTEKWA